MKISDARVAPQPFYKDKDLCITVEVDDMNRFKTFHVVVKKKKNSFPVNAFDVLGAWKKLEEFVNKNL